MILRYKLKYAVKWLPLKFVQMKRDASNKNTDRARKRGIMTGSMVELENSSGINIIVTPTRIYVGREFNFIKLDLIIPTDEQNFRIIPSILHLDLRGYTSLPLFTALYINRISNLILHLR